MDSSRAAAISFGTPYRSELASPLVRPFGLRREVGILWAAVHFVRDRPRPVAVLNHRLEQILHEIDQMLRNVV